MLRRYGVKDLQKALPACRIDCGPMRFARSGLQRLPARGNEMEMEADAVVEIEAPEEGLDCEFTVNGDEPGSADYRGQVYPLARDSFRDPAGRIGGPREN